jgi:hypothetical protein
MAPQLSGVRPPWRAPIILFAVFSRQGHGGLRGGGHRPILTWRPGSTSVFMRRLGWQAGAPGVALMALAPTPCPAPGAVTRLTRQPNRPPRLVPWSVEYSPARIAITGFYTAPSTIGRQRLTTRCCRNYKWVPILIAGLHVGVSGFSLQTPSGAPTGVRRERY